MKMAGFVNEFLSAASEGPRIYFAPIVGALRAVRSELNPSGTRAFMKSSVEISVTPARKRKR
jgi:hypothetical protein